jgi:tetratricopeptide (TPR) repeat protein
VGGDSNIAARLAGVAIPLMFQLCSLEESQRWINIALEVLSRSTPDSLLQQVKLCIASCALYLNAGCQNDAVWLASTQRAIAIADRTRDDLPRAIARQLQIICDLTSGNPAVAVTRLAELEEIVACASEPHLGALFDRVTAQAHHFNGEYVKSRAHAQRALASARQRVQAPILYANHALDHRISMRIILARTAWLEGRADEALQISSECVELARQDRAFALGQVLTLCACPIAFWRGDLAAAHSYTEELAHCARRYGLSPVADFARCYRLVLTHLAGEDTDLLDPAYPANTLQSDHLGTVSDQWLNRATLARAEQGLTGWCTAEILRRHAEMTLQKGDPETSSAAERCLRQALAVARAQGAHAWEVRVCMSLVRLHAAGAQCQSALQELESAYGNLQGGQSDGDAIQARGLLEGLRNEPVLSVRTAG